MGTQGKQDGTAGTFKKENRGLKEAGLGWIIGGRKDQDFE